MKRWYLFMLVALAALCLAFTVAPAHAADTRGGDQVTIGRDEVIAGDMYVAGQSVTLDGTVKGDLIVGAGQVLINGTVEGDVLASAQSVLINGTVGDDLRVLAQAAMLGPNARVGGDLAFGGASLESQAGSNISGDLLLGAYQAQLSGAIGRDLRGGLNRLALLGAVGGNVDVRLASADNTASALRFSPTPLVTIPAVPAGLTLADSARIGGTLSYTSNAAAGLNPRADIGGGVAVRPAAPTQPTQSPNLPGLAMLRRLVALLLVGALLVFVAPAWLSGLANTVEQRPLPSLGWGLLAFGAFIVALISVVVATIALAVIFGYLTLGGLVAMIVGVGLLLNGALIVGYIAFAAYIAEAVIALAAGRWLLRQARPAWAEQPLAPLALGLAVYVLLRAVPVLGAVLALLVMLVGMGALWQWGRASYRRGQPTPAPLVGLQPA